MVRLRHLLFVSTFGLAGVCGPATPPPPPRAPAAVPAPPAPAAPVLERDSVRAPLRVVRERQVYLVPAVRRYLQSQWDTVNAWQPERAYCLAAHLERHPSGDWVWVVTQATRVVPSWDTPVSISYDCANQPSLHTHPPTTCTSVSGCWLGGPMAHEGFPSPIDKANAGYGGAPFILIQFDRNAFVAVFPLTNADDAAVAPTATPVPTPVPGAP